MSVCVGIDVHRKHSQVAVIDQDGEVLANRNVPNGVRPILSVIGGLPTGTSAIGLPVSRDQPHRTLLEVLAELPARLCHRPSSFKAMCPRYEGKPTSTATSSRTAPSRRAAVRVLDRVERLPRIRALVIAVLEDQRAGGRAADVIDLLVQRRQGQLVIVQHRIEGHGRLPVLWADRAGPVVLEPNWLADEDEVDPGA